MNTYVSHLEIFESEKTEMLRLLKEWVNINSYSDHIEGLLHMADAIESAFSNLNGVSERIPLLPRKKIDSKGNLIECSTGHVLSIKKHPHAKLKILLAGHLDTVYPPHSPFQTAEQLSQEILRGPGAADMKGGIVIMLKALEIFEKSPFAGKIGWEVLINPDEEVGSPSSQFLFLQKAPQYRMGLIFEPSFPDGSLVSQRKGSINYTIVARGKAAHAGRDFYEGRNAIMALARFIQAIENLNDKQKGITVNIGSFEGGEATNIVPDLAISKVNIRLQNPEDISYISNQIQKILHSFSNLDGIHFKLHEHGSRPPKLFDKNHLALFETLKQCAQELNCDLKWQPSGGVCDGNTLAHAGLPTIDTLGAIGKNIHTHDEFIFIPSLASRAQLTASFLMHVANHEPLIGE